LSQSALVLADFLIGKAQVIFNFGSINIDHAYRVAYFVRPGETLESNEYSVGLGGKGVNQSLAIGMIDIYGTKIKNHLRFPNQKVSQHQG